MKLLCPYCLEQTSQCATLGRAGFPPLEIVRTPSAVCTAWIDKGVHRLPASWKQGQSLVWGEGCPERCTGMIIGEAPGEWEEHLGRPFVGESGQKLMEALKAAGASRTQFYITNVYKLRPLDLQGKNQEPSRKQIKCHSRYLCEELETVRPCAVLLLGGSALRTLLKREGVEKHRKKPVSCHGRVYFPTFHPSHLLRGGSAHSRLFFKDVERFVRLASHAPSPQNSSPSAHHEE
jgi:uracil-DNA glycosylase